MNCFKQWSLKTWCGTFHKLVTKDICESIKDSLIIVLFLFLLKIGPKNFSNIILKNLL
jgi:hypothetical protein